MGFEAFTQAFDSAYKSTTERKSMFDDDNGKKSSSHWGDTESEETVDTKGDEYAEYLTTFDTKGSKKLLNTPPAVVSAYDNTSEADHLLLKDNNIQAFNIDEHGKNNSFLSKIWQGTFGKGETYDNSTDYYASHLKGIKDQKGLDLVNKAKDMNISLPEGSIWDSTTYGNDQYKLIQTAIDNEQKNIDYEKNDPKSTTNMMKAQKEAQLKMQQEHYDKVTAEQKVDAANKARHANEKATIAANNKRTQDARVDKNTIAAYNEHGDAAGEYGGFNADDFDNSADAKAYYEDKSVDSGEVGSGWKNKIQSLMPGGKTGRESTNISQFESDTRAFDDKKTKELDRMNTAMRNDENKRLDKEGIEQDDKDQVEEWANEPSEKIEETKMDDFGDWDDPVEHPDDIEKRRKTNELAGWNKQLTDSMDSGDLDKYGTKLFEEHGDAEDYFRQDKDKGMGNLLKRVLPGGDDGMSSVYDRDVDVQKKGVATATEKNYQSTNANQLKMLNDPKMKNMKPFAKNINFLNKKFKGNVNEMLKAVEGGQGGNFTSLIEDMGQDGINSLTSDVAKRELGMDGTAFDNFKKLANILLEKRS